MIGLLAWGAAAAFSASIGEAGVQAIVMSAGIAFTVQCLTFGVAMALMPAGAMVGYGAGAFMRLFVVAVHGFIGVRLLGLPMAPALISLASFFFVTSLIEPFFLIRRDPQISKAPTS